MNVREATIDDAEVIARVHVHTWQTAYRGLIPDDHLDSLSIDRGLTTWRTRLAERDPAQPNWVAKLEHEVVGFASAGTSRDVGTYGMGELFAIYVMPEFQALGVGRDLMGVAVVWLASRFKAATLWVLEGNVPTLRFYEKLGWRFDGTKKQDVRGSFILNELRYRIDFEKSPDDDVVPGAIV